MARREIWMEELIEVLYQWHLGRNISRIKHSLGMARKTIRKYIELAEKHGFSRDMPIQSYLYYLELAGKIQKALKTPVDTTPGFRKTALYQATIEKLRDNRYMTPKQIYRVLKRNYEYPLSYSTFNRYYHIQYPKLPRHCLRIELGAAEEAQVDYGYAGKMYDPMAGRMRRAYAFILTLSYSRLAYVEFVFDQGQLTWVKCHMNAFRFFNGVVRRLVIDNLKSGVLKPNTYDPLFNRAYAECAKHYGFVIDPARPGKGEHKGKVERKIPVVRQQFLSFQEFRDITEANEKVKHWCLHDYGMQIHGTIKRKPFEVFELEEKAQLKAMPRESFDLPLWKQAKVHPDHHIVFDKSYYSLPTRYVGKEVWARGGLYQVRIFHEGELIKTHQRAYKPGTWRTDERDYPPEKSKYLLRSISYYQRQALKHGSYVCQLVTRIMTEHAYRNLRKVQGLFRLAEKYGSQPLDLTCRRCLFYEDYRMSTIKRVLKQQLYLLCAEEEGSREATISSPLGQSFIRPSTYFSHTQEESA